VLQAYVDEEGHIKQLPFNDIASTLYANRHGGINGCFLYGSLVIWLPDATIHRKGASRPSAAPGASAKG
jgi:hypothetical protein